MKGSRVAMLAGAIATLCLAGSAGLSRSNQPSGSAVEKNRFSHIKGMRVQDPNGEDLGVVKDFVLDTQSGQAKYAIIASGGLFGIGARSRAVPSRTLSAATAKRNILAISIHQARWEKAPMFDGELAALSDQHRALQLNKYYGQTFSEGKLAQKNPPPGPGRAFSPTGRENGEPGGARAGLQFASDMIGTDIVNRQQEDIGEVSDLLLDLEGQKPALAIISAGKLLQRNKRYAVPVRLLSLRNRNKLELDANRKLFEQAPLFNPKAWQDGTRTDVVFRFPDKERDDTRGNAHDREVIGLMLLEQSRADADRRLTDNLVNPLEIKNK